MSLNSELITALTAFGAMLIGYCLRFYTTKNEYQLKTQINEKDLLEHLLELQKQVVILTNQNAQLLAEVESLRTEVSTLRTTLRSYRRRPSGPAQRDRIPAAAAKDFD